MTEYGTEDYRLMRVAAQALIEVIMNTDQTPEQVWDDLRPMLDEDIDEF